MLVPQLPSRMTQLQRVVTSEQQEAVFGDIQQDILNLFVYLERLRAVLVSGETFTIPNGPVLTPGIGFNRQVNTQSAGLLSIRAPETTPVDGASLVIALDCTNTQTLSFAPIYRAGTLALPATALGTVYVFFLYNAPLVRYDLVHLASGY